MAIIPATMGAPGYGNFGNSFAGNLFRQPASAATTAAGFGLSPWMMAAGIGGSLLGGLLGRRDARAPESLNNQIEALQNPNYYAPLLQRIIGDGQQGYANMTRGLARQGVGANANLLNEIQQAGQQDATDQLTQAMRGMEGQRLSSLGQLQNIRLGYRQMRQGATDAGLTGMLSTILNGGLLAGMRG